MTEAEAIEWLTGLYGDAPGEVGKIDGTEDDWGDLIVADLPHAVTGRALPDDFSDDARERFEERVGAAKSWPEALAIAREILSDGPPVIRVERSQLFHGRQALRPYGWLYKCTGPDARRFDNRSIVELRAVLRSRYGHAVFIIETWKG